jgi:hypothetical protein
MKTINEPQSKVFLLHESNGRGYDKTWLSISQETADSKHAGVVEVLNSWDIPADLAVLLDVYFRKLRNFHQDDIIKRCGDA